MERRSVFPSQPLDKPHQFLPLFRHGGIKSRLHVLGEEFEHEGALFVLTYPPQRALSSSTKAFVSSR